MSQYDSPQVSRNQELLSQEESAPEAFIRSALYTGVQYPLSGAAQLLDRSLGTNTLPSLQLIDAPKESFAAQLGSVAATTGHVALMMAAGHKIGGPLTDASSFAKRGLATAALGAAYGGVFTPVLGDSNNFAAARMQNMAAGAAGMGAMSVYYNFYNKTLGKDLSFLDAPPFFALTPAAMAGLGTMADLKLKPEGNTSVFLPGSKMLPAESFYKPTENKKR